MGLYKKGIKIWIERD